MTIQTGVEKGLLAKLDLLLNNCKKAEKKHFHALLNVQKAHEELRKFIQSLDKV